MGNSRTNGENYSTSTNSAVKEEAQTRGRSRRAPNLGLGKGGNKRGYIRCDRDQEQELVGGMRQTEKTAYAKALQATENIILSGAKRILKAAPECKNVYVHALNSKAITTSWVNKWESRGRRKNQLEEAARGDPWGAPPAEEQSRSSRVRVGLAREWRYKRQEKEKELWTLGLQNIQKEKRSTMLNGVMITMQGICGISNKEANSDLVKNYFSGLIGRA